MTPDPAILDRLRSAGLIGDGEATAVPLSGGVASDIWRTGAVVVKQALEKLRVAADWQVPTTRNACEVVWLQVAGAAVPGCAPEVLAHWPDLGAFVMPWLSPDSHPVWKSDLLAGHSDTAFAARVGAKLAAVHGATAGRDDLAVNDDGLFRAIRLEPYFGHLRAAYPGMGGFLDVLIDNTLANKKALVHGDVSPKNILMGPAGPVFLDAECAWYGDPAFDLAFVLNHLLLKSLTGVKSLDAFDALAQAYLAGVNWEEARDLEERAARLLPGLLLARIDGKSPVDYIDAKDGARVRAFASLRLVQPPSSLAHLARGWRQEMLQETFA